MARVILHPNAKSEIGVAVGTLDGQVLSFVDKAPYVGGRPVEFSDIGYDVSIAVEEAAIVIFGQEWSTDLGRVTGLNRRTVTRDRIERFGVAPWVYEMLGRAATSPCPRAFGFQLLAAAELCDRGPYALKGVKKWGANIRQRVELGVMARYEMEKAWSEIDRARTESETYRISKDTETEQ
jgi:hypothetical protein